MRIGKLLMSIVLLSLASCSQKEYDVIDGIENQVISAYLRGADTRVNIQDDNSLVWTSGDVFVAFEKSNTSKTYLFSTKENGNEANFTSDAKSSVQLDYAIYPYSEQYPQTITRDVLSMYLPSSFTYTAESGIGVPLYGHINNGMVGFAHLAGALRIRLSNCPDWAKSIVVSASSPISGFFTADLKDDNPILTSSSKNDNDMTIKVDFDITNSTIYIPLPAQKYDKIIVKLIGDEKDVDLANWANKEVKVANIYTASITYPVSSDDIYSSLEEAYSSFAENDIMGVMTLDNYLFGDVVGADANKGSQYADQANLRDIETYAINMENPYLLDRWNMIYNSVKKANKVIDLASNNKSVISDSDAVIGQAKFIKAVWMFEGIKMFGSAIPYVSLDDYQKNNLYQGSNIDTKGKYKYIWSLVEQDLKDAVNKLPTTGNYRINSWTAKSLLAKLYVYWSSPYNGTNGNVNHWNDASKLLEDIINNGQNIYGDRLELAGRYGDIFNTMYPDVTESIFTIKFKRSTAIIPPGALGYGGWGFYQPTNEFVNSYLVDNDGLPISNYTGYYPLTIVNYYYVDKYDLDSAVDPRLDYCAGRVGVPYLDYGIIPNDLNGWVRDITNGGPYINKKSQLNKYDGYIIFSKTMPSQAYHVIRFADILLLKAECAIEDGDLATALHLINQVRARVANGYVKNNDAGKEMNDLVNGQVYSDAAATYRIGLYKKFGTKQEAITALERERRAEFGMEGHRWFDIARWGKVGKELNKFREFESKYIPDKYVNTYNEKWVTFPIPKSIIDESNGKIIQNENWK